MRAHARTPMRVYKSSCTYFSSEDMPARPQHPWGPGSVQAAQSPAPYSENSLQHFLSPVTALPHHTSCSLPGTLLWNCTCTGLNPGCMFKLGACQGLRWVPTCQQHKLPTSCLQLSPILRAKIMHMQSLQADQHQIRERNSSSSRSALSSQACSLRVLARSALAGKRPLAKQLDAFRGPGSTAAPTH